MFKAFVLIVLSFIIMSAFTGSAYALSKIGSSPETSMLNQGQTEQITVTLDTPIICSDPGPSCDVELNFASSDPNSISIDNPTLTWSQSQWYEPMQFNVTALAPSDCATSETDTISATAVSNAEYYSGFQTSFTVTINSQPPYTAPSLSNQTVNLTNNGSSTDTNVINGVNDCPDISTLAIVSGPSHGTAVDPPGVIAYTPNNGYVGEDSLVYKLCSLLDNTVCSTATINYNIAAGGPSTPDTGYGQPTNNSSELKILILASVFSIAVGIGTRRLVSHK